MSIARSLLLPYQRRWADDDSRFKMGLMARQIGKDFATAEEGIRDCITCETKGSKATWLIVAPSERQSLESLSKWKEWAEAYSLEISDFQEERASSQSLIKSATITFPGGSRVIAVPGKPDTVRGFSAHVVATEFAFFEDPDATWRALLPSIINPLRGGQKKIRLITTPNGLGNKAADLWNANFGIPGAEWSCHKVTLQDAQNEGLEVDVERLRAAVADPDLWAQEFELEFLDAQAVLLPYELLAKAETVEASDTVSADFWEASGEHPRVMGIDFGRKKDLTVAWTDELMAGLHVAREVLCLEKMATPAQVELLAPRIRSCRRVALDYTGPGVGLGDYLVKEFGEWAPDKDKFGKIELCTFTNALKVDIFSKLKMAFEAGKARIPINRVIREDLHSVNRCSTPGGVITYKAPHTEDGHADRATAKALAQRAGTQDHSGVRSMQGIFVGGNRSGIKHFQPRRLVLA